MAKNKDLDFIRNDRAGAFGKSDAQLQALSLDNILKKSIESIFQQIVDKLTQNLIDSKSNASRELTKSIQFEVTTDGSQITARISLEDYYRYTDEGVKGVESTDPSAVNSPFEFKSIYPNKKMAGALGRWITKKGVGPLKYNRKQPRSRKKLKEVIDARRSLAYAITTNVKKHGIKATRFYSSVINKDTIAQIERDLTTQLGRQISVKLIEPNQ